MKRFIKLLLCCSLVCLSFISVSANEETTESTPIQIEANNNTAEVTFVLPEDNKELTVTTDFYTVDPLLFGIKKIGTLYTTLVKSSKNNNQYYLHFNYRKELAHKKEWYALGFNVTVERDNLLSPKRYTNLNVYMKTDTVSSNIYKDTGSFTGEKGKKVRLNFSKCFVDFYESGRLYTTSWTEYGYKM